MQEIVDTFLDGNGKVVTDPKLGVEMRRVVFENGRVVKQAVYYNQRFMSRQEPTAPAPKSAKGWTPARGV